MTRIAKAQGNRKSATQTNGRWVLLAVLAVMGLKVAVAPALAEAQDGGVRARIPFTMKDPNEAISQQRVFVKLRGGSTSAKSLAQPTLPHVASLTAISSTAGKNAKGMASSTWFVAELDGSVWAEDALRELSVHEDVESVEPDYIRAIPAPFQSMTFGAAQANDNYSYEQYALDNMRLHDAWNIHPGSQDVVVAIIDSGIQLDHPDITNQLWRNAGEELNGVDDDGNGYVDDVFGYDFVNYDSNPSDDYGHGTHVAGIVAATRNNNMGIAGAANVRVMACKVLAADGNGADSGIIAALEYAINNGADVINMSLGGGSYNAAFDEVCSRAYARGILVVAATGNEYASQIGFPSSLSSVVAVGATDVNDQVADFSNVGQGIELVAPGVQILSTYPGSSFEYLDGTSMATPYVAGLAALILSAHPQMDVQTLRGTLASTADDIYDSGYDTWSGYGRVNAYRALTENGSPVAPPTNNPNPGTPVGNDDQYEPNNHSGQAVPIGNGQYNLAGFDEDWFAINVTAGGQMSVSLSGQQGDLDLYVFDTTGQTLAASEEYGSQEQVSLQVNPGSYFVAVGPYQNQGSTYTLTVNAPGAVPTNPTNPGKPGQPTNPLNPTTPGFSDPSLPAPAPVITGGCGAGAAEAMMVGMLSMIGLVGANRRRW